MISWSEFFNVGYAEWLDLSVGLPEIGYEIDAEPFAIIEFEYPFPDQPVGVAYIPIQRGVDFALPLSNRIYQFHGKPIAQRKFPEKPPGKLKLHSHLTPR
jgi:hypothetical protein